MIQINLFQAKKDSLGGVEEAKAGGRDTRRQS
jgi:hypothetical protein